MWFPTYGVLSAFRVPHFTFLILRILHGILGTRGLITLLRVAVAGATAAFLLAAARLMWALPATADITIASGAAIAWVRWIEQRGQQ